MTVTELQQRIEKEVGIPASKQKLIHKGKVLSGLNGEILLHYKINYNETIQVHKRVVLEPLDDGENLSLNNKAIEAEKEKEERASLEDVESDLYKIGDLVDVKDVTEGSDTLGAFFEAKISRITRNPDASSDDDGLNYHIVYDKYPNDDTDYRISSLNLRPRACRLVNLGDLVNEQSILVNFNQRDPEKLGEWYDASVTEVNARKKVLVVTLFVGVAATPLPDTAISQLEQIFQVEKPLPIEERALKPKKERSKVVARQHTVECETCEDKDSKKCKDCGCNKCGKKDNPEEQIICDECQLNFHLKCIGLKELPEDDFYCSGCKREDTTIKEGDALINKRLKNAPSQTKVQKRDWGKGFACAGRTTTNDKVAMDHKGPVPGTEVGMTWLYRIQLSEVGIMRPPVAGIHANEKMGAMSIVLNGGYEDDKDMGDEFFYTGSGGRDLSGNKRTNDQSFDQELTKANKGLAQNCDAPVNLEGAEAKDWKKGIPVRVTRGWKLRKHAPEYAPEAGFRYDGIYKVVKYYKQKGESGFNVWRYLLRRDDESAAPWTKEGKKKAEERGWKVILPDGYVAPQPKEKGGKKRKAEDEESKENAGPSAKMKKFSLSDSLKKLIKADKHNEKFWKKFLEQSFVSFESMQRELEGSFECSVCMNTVSVPVKLECRHNMCQVTCFARMNKEAEKDQRKCPSCRAQLDGEEPVNAELRAILNFVFPGSE